MSHEKTALVEVEIFGQSYALRAGEDPGYLKTIAGHVDQHMKRVALSAGAVDSVRIAVLAALNIADELMQARLAAQGDTRLHGRVARIERELDAILSD